MTSLKECSKKAHVAAGQLRGLDISIRNQVLNEYADTLELHQSELISENLKDLVLSKQCGMNASMLDRLMLNTDRIHQMAEGIRQVSALEDPLGIVLENRTLASGLKLRKITVPFGVIGIIYESRPNVTADCAALAFKAGSAVILKGGKESWNSSSLITKLFQNTLLNHNIPPDAVQLAEHPDHEEVMHWIEDRSSVDLLLPRGSRRLIRSVVDHAKVPVIETGAGICHVYVDQNADLDMAEKIIVNAKTSRPSVCNAMETLLIHQQIADEFTRRIVTALLNAGVRTIYGDNASQAIDSRISPSEIDSYSTEYDDLLMNIAIVKDVKAAAAH
ncbi:MAG: glutamate-5-semialdehyde dehydrogenase, partial [Erysipelotrichia bacterium]|nr:glutamate-5-semialdehyde dehydrogenase [Erysipelotrichia bacterium]